MKNPNPVISLLICGLVLLTGCASTPKSSLPAELKAPNTDYPSTVTILAPSFFVSAYENNEIRQQWIDEMSQRYGVNFNIVANFHTDSGEYDTSAGDLALAMLDSETSFKGIFPVFGIGSDNSALKAALEHNVVLPLEDYLEDNPVWNALPEDFKSLFELDGHIYAIPTSVSLRQYTRVIRTEALEKTGKTVTDLNSFRDFAVAYKQKTGNAAISSINVREMTDILNAFGLYPDGNDPFGYDPTENCYADWLTKEAAVDALEYLRELYKAGAIYLSYDEDYKKFDSGIIATRFFMDFNEDSCTKVFTLNPEYPQIAHTYREGFTMTEGTPQPRETINLLVNMLFGSEENYLECRLGLSDNYTLNSDGTITMELQPDSEGNYIYPYQPNLVGGLPDIFPYSDADIYYSQNGVVDMESKTNAGKTNARSKQQDELIKNGTVVKIPLLFQNMRSATYEANKWDVNKLYRECFQKVIVSRDKTVQQVVDEYKEAMLNLGGNIMLDEMNAGIGKKTAYYYG